MQIGDTFDESLANFGYGVSNDLYYKNAKIYILLLILMQIGDTFVGSLENLGFGMLQMPHTKIVIHKSFY